MGKIGLGENDLVVDIGAGSGVFTIPAAKLTNNFVYALDINSEFLKIIDEKAKQEGLHNIVTMKSEIGKNYKLKKNIADIVLLVTVLHEVEDKDGLLSEIKRIIKNGGTLAIIEFHKRETAMGPPVSQRISREEIVSLCSKYGFELSNEINLGNNLYCIWGRLTKY